jgi:histidinol-phosphate aminotransferase
MSITRRNSLSLMAGSLVAPGLAGPALSAPQPEHSGEAKARLGVTENPFGPSPAARRAIVESVAEAAYYPHSEARCATSSQGRKGWPATISPCRAARSMR